MLRAMLLLAFLFLFRGTLHDDIFCAKAIIWVFAAIVVAVVIVVVITYALSPTPSCVILFFKKKKKVILQIHMLLLLDIYFSLNTCLFNFHYCFINCLTVLLMIPLHSGY